jgi:hypothetical protein
VHLGSIDILMVTACTFAKSRVFNELLVFHSSLKVISVKIRKSFILRQLLSVGILTRWARVLGTISLKTGSCYICCILYFSVCFRQ